MNRVLYFLIGLFFSFPAFCQSSRAIDSLETILESTSQEEDKLELCIALAKEASAALDSAKAIRYIELALIKADQLQIPEKECEALIVKSSIKFYHHLIPESIEIAHLAYTQAKRLASPLFQAQALLMLNRCEYSVGNYKTSLDYALQSLELYEQHQEDRIGAKSYLNVGRVYKRMGDYQQTAKYYKQALALLKIPEDGLMLIATYNSLGSLNVQLGQYVEGLQYYLKGIEITKKMQEKPALAVYYHNLGNLYSSIDDFSQAIEYLERSKEINMALNDPYNLSLCNLNLSEAHRNAKQTDLALQYAREGYNRSYTVDFKRGKLLANIQMASVFLELEEVDSAQAYLPKALEMGLEQGDKHAISSAYGFLGRLFYLQKNYPQSLDYLQKGLEIAQAMGRPRSIQFIKKYQADTYEALGDHTNSHKVLMEFQSLKDSLFNQKVLKRIAFAEAEAKFRHEQDSTRLAQASEKLLLESKLEYQEGQQNWTNLVVFLLITLILIIILFYRSKVKDNRDLARLNHEIVLQNDKIKEQKDQLQETLRYKDQFFSIISHDLRGPVHSFSSLNPLIENAIQNRNVEQLAHYMKMLDKSSKNLSQLLENLLVWSRQEQGLIPYEPRSVDVKACLDKTLSLYSFQIESKRITVQSSIQMGLEVWADQNSLEVILRNLINNAIKFTPEDGYIKLSTEVQRKDVAIIIQDTGVGISPQNLSSLFDLHHKKSSPGTHGEAGSGLGLTLVHNFVKMNEGSISVESTLGQGTSFTVSLPLSKKAPSLPKNVSKMA